MCISDIFNDKEKRQFSSLLNLYKWRLCDRVLLEIKSQGLGLLHAIGGGRLCEEMLMMSPLNGFFSGISHFYCTQCMTI